MPLARKVSDKRLLQVGGRFRITGMQPSPLAITTSMASWRMQKLWKRMKTVNA
jgi:hypothetical protein